MEKAYHHRLTQFQATLSSDQAVLLSTNSDITYFTGFQFLVPEEREAFLCITPNSATLIKAHFSPAPALSFVHQLNGCRPTQLAEHIKHLIVTHKVKQLLLDEATLFVSELRALEDALKSQVTFAALDPAEVWQFRLIKDQTEITALQKAGLIISQVMSSLSLQFKTGITERALAEYLDQQLRHHGAIGSAFPTIVAFGAHATEPHYQPGETPLIENTAILVDAGARYQGYRSDMTRTFWFGEKPSAEFQNIETIVHRAYEAAITRLSERPVTAKDLDLAARELIQDAGYGEHFIHTTGHGIGLDIHEPPSLTLHNPHPILPGMVITIEPGIYVPNQLGYRYENTILVTENGFEPLTADTVQ